MVTNLPFPDRSPSTVSMTVCRILLSTITSFAEDARAIIATAGSIATAPCTKQPSTFRKSLHTSCPAIRPEIRKLAARMGIARPEIARIHAIATSKTPWIAKKAA